MPFKLATRAGKTCVVKKTGETVKCHDSRDEAVAHLRALMTNIPDAKSYTAASLLCGGAVNPPLSFFTNPELPELQRWTTITAEGRVLGHAAGRSECHIGFLDRCVTIDVIADCRGEGNFEYALPGYVLTAEGVQVATGPIPIKGGHADKSVSWQAALSHYDDPSCVVADVVYGMDSFGVWFSGNLRPTATEADIYTLRASGVSLDARSIDGSLRYLATCCVNSPGYPKVSVALAASADDTEPVITALIGAGGLPEPIISDELPCAPCEEDAALNALTDRLLSPLDDRILASLESRITH